MAPQPLQKIESAPGIGRVSEASNPQDVVHGRAAGRAQLRLTGRQNEKVAKLQKKAPNALKSLDAELKSAPVFRLPNVPSSIPLAWGARSDIYGPVAERGVRFDDPWLDRGIEAVAPCAGIQNRIRASVWRGCGRCKWLRKLFLISNLVRRSSVRSLIELIVTSCATMRRE